MTSFSRQPVLLPGLFDPPAPDWSTGLRPYQRAAVEGVFAKLTDFRSTLLVMPTGTGKCLGRGTEVLMASGVRWPVETIATGDRIMGHDGQVRTVLSTTSGRGSLFRITPTKGEPWICNDVHVLTLVHTETGETVDVPLNEYLAKTKNWKHCHKLFREGVDRFEASGPSGATLDPYFLGVILGDGSTVDGGVSVCKPDPEIREECEAQAALWGLRLRVAEPHTSAPVYHLVTDDRGRGHVNKLAQALRDLGAYQSCGTKRVPAGYLRSSRGMRRLVLAGLMDTDGSLTCNGFDFISKSPQLADDVTFLARSVGLAAYTKPCQKSCQTGAVGTYYRVSISGDTDAIPTRIPRKQAAPRQQKKNVLRTGFTVEAIGEGEYFGFELDGDGRFLLGDFTVTHNTTVFGAVAQRWPRQQKVLVLAHRDELISQAAARLRRATGALVDIEQAEQRAAGSRYVVGSVQTLSRPRRLARFSPDHFGLVIIDEAHHATASTYRRILDHFGAANVLGVTATPDRADETAMGVVFDSVAYTYGIDEAIVDGWLCPLRIRIVEIESVNLSSVRTTAGDLNAGDLDAIMATEESIHGVVRPTIESAEDRRTIVFTTSVATAHRMAEVFNRYRAGSSRAVDGDTPTEERREILRAHRAGEFQYLVNVGVLTEGYDDPGLACIAMARPTKSRALYTQCIGRGLRSSPGKTDCLVLDFVGASGRHRLVSALDILGGKFSDAEVKAAAKLVSKEPGKRVDEALVEAKRKLIEQQRQAEAARRLAAQAEVRYKTSDVDPFGVFHVSQPMQGPTHGDKPVTAKQLAALQQLGVDVPKGLSFEQAIKLLDVAYSRNRRGLATYKQIKTLARYNVDAISMRKPVATEVISAIVANGWRQLDTAQLRAITGRTRDVGEEG